jgi:hypothetical protein
LLVGPSRIAWSTQSAGAVWRNVKHNWKQLTGPDQAGMRFGALYSIREAYNEIMTPIPPIVHAAKPQPTIPPRWQHKVAPGDWLSKLAIKYYNDMDKWPIIYDANRDKIKDPNRLPPNVVLAIPDLGSLTPTEILEAKKRAKTWKSHTSR